MPVDALAALVGPDAGEAPVGDGDVALEPLARERAEHLRALDHGVRRLLTARDGQQAGGRRRVVHAGTVAAPGRGSSGTAVGRAAGGPSGTHGVCHLAGGRASP